MNSQGTEFARTFVETTHFISTFYKCINKIKSGVFFLQKGLGHFLWKEALKGVKATAYDTLSSGSPFPLLTIISSSQQRVVEPDTHSKGIV